MAVRAGVRRGLGREAPALSPADCHEKCIRWCLVMFVQSQEGLSQLPSRFRISTQVVTTLPAFQPALAFRSREQKWNQYSTSGVHLWALHLSPGQRCGRRKATYTRLLLNWVRFIHMLGTWWPELVGMGRKGNRQIFPRAEPTDNTLTCRVHSQEVHILRFHPGPVPVSRQGEGMARVSINW